MPRWCGGVFLAALALGCSHGAERMLLDQFFSQSRLLDRTALQSFATVQFQPHLDGTITTFTIVSVSPEETRPLADVVSETRVAELSVEDPRQPVTIPAGGGEMVSKEVTIEAPVRLPDGRTVGKTLNIILQRAMLKGDREIAGRWIVTGVAARETER